MDSKSGSRIGKMGFKVEQFLDDFLFNYRLCFRCILGPILGSKWAKKRQDGPKKDFKSLKVPKSSICKKCCFLKGKQHFSSLGGSQDEHKTLKTALKRHVKSFKTQKKNVPKHDLIFSIFWTNFWTELGPKMVPNFCKKLVQNGIKSGITCMLASL